MARPVENLNGLAAPHVKELALALTATAENSTTRWRDTYGYIELDVEDVDAQKRGYTAGIVGWTTSTGDLLELVRRYDAAHPRTRLARWLPRLRRIMAEPVYTRRKDLARRLLGPAFVADWRAEARTPAFRAMQRAERDRVYWMPAYRQAVADRVGPLGLAILYDISVNHGPGTDRDSFGGIVALARASARPPSRGGSERAYLEQLVTRRDAALVRWGDREARVDGRVAMHRALLRSNPGLRLPIRWSVYGDDFTLTSWPVAPAGE